ncbi:MAG TPA: hypothetical protein VGK73_26625 [Polyangiaceae bacterium]
MALAVLGSACGLSTARDIPPAEGTGGDLTSPEDVPCGKALPLCEVDRCTDGACTFVEIARVPGPAFKTRVDDTHIYVLGEYESTIYRTPKCGGTTSAVLRTVGAISSFALSGSSLYWTTNTAPGGALYRSPKDGSGPTEQIVFDGQEPIGFAFVSSDLTEAYATRSTSPGLLRLEQDGVHVVSEAPFEATLFWDSEFFYVNDYERGTRRIDKIDGSEMQLIEPGPVVRAVDDRALYYTFYDPPAVANSRPAEGLFRLPTDGGAAEALVYLSSLLLAAADGRCAYLTLSHATGSSQETTTRRLRLDGREDAVVFGNEQHHVTLDADAVYVTTASGSLYRRPK